MAISAYTGVPGSGKSYALVSDVILPALRSGRRVLTNVDGCDPERFYAYLEAEGLSTYGRLVCFDSDDALLPGFFPTSEKPDGRVILPGDLLVFDEWRLTFSNRSSVGNVDLEPFLRWHRHLVNAEGVSTDVVIGTQLITDIHRDFRGLVASSYKFRKLSALGLNRTYHFDIYEGSEQKKGQSYRSGTGRFKQEIFDLYKSYNVDGNATESVVDKRFSFFSKWYYLGGAIALIFIVVGGFRVVAMFSDSASSDLDTPGVGQSSIPTRSGSYLPSLSQPDASAGSFRIVGTIYAPEGQLVVISDDKGRTRSLSARDFVFENGRPVYGFIDGVKIYAEDRIIQGSGPGGFNTGQLVGQLP